MTIPNYAKLIIALALPQLAGLIGTVFTFDAIPTWYATLVKPALNPPSWIFGPVWTTLYVLMGIATYIVWKKGLERKEVKIALGIFLGQLILNSLWSLIFFGGHYLLGALIEIIVLWISIVATIVVFHRISKVAAYLLIPYLAWVSFATYLTFSLWRLN